MLNTSINVSDSCKLVLNDGEACAQSRRSHSHVDTNGSDLNFGAVSATNNVYSTESKSLALRSESEVLLSFKAEQSIDFDNADGISIIDYIQPMEIDSAVSRARNFE